MTSETTMPTAEVCNALSDRLRSAEAKVNAALGQTEAGHPLADATNELLAIHKEVRGLILDSFGSDGETSTDTLPQEVADAAIQIEKEEHTLKPDFLDVLKAVFMWKDDPADRVNGG